MTNIFTSAPTTNQFSVASTNPFLWRIGIQLFQNKKKKLCNFSFSSHYTMAKHIDRRFVYTCKNLASVKMTGFFAIDWCTTFLSTGSYRLGGDLATVDWRHSPAELSNEVGSDILTGTENQATAEVRHIVVDVERSDGKAFMLTERCVAMSKASQRISNTIGNWGIINHLKGKKFVTWRLRRLIDTYQEWQCKLAIKTWKSRSVRSVK